MLQLFLSARDFLVAFRVFLRQAFLTMKPLAIMNEMRAALLDVQQRYPDFAIAVAGGKSRVTRVTYGPDGQSVVENMTAPMEHVQTVQWLRDFCWGGSMTMNRKVSL